jgi:hypothetical protein
VRVLEVDPPLDGDLLVALSAALARVGVDPDERPAAYSSAWSRTAAREAVEGLPARETYAFSPRSTRGATRA